MLWRMDDEKRRWTDICSKIRINVLIVVVLFTAVVIAVVLHTDFERPIPGHLWGVIGSYATAMSMLATKLIEKD